MDSGIRIGKSATPILMPWLILLCATILGACLCCCICAFGRPVIEYDFDEEPDPGVVGEEFHKEWLSESNKILLRRRGAGKSSLVGAPSEQLMGLMMHDAHK
jgi:hypothetical protein